MAIHKQIGEEANPTHRHHQNDIEVNALFPIHIQELIYSEVRDYIDSD